MPTRSKKLLVGCNTMNTFEGRLSIVDPEITKPLSASLPTSRSRCESLRPCGTGVLEGLGDLVAFENKYVMLFAVCQKFLTHFLTVFEATE